MSKKRRPQHPRKIARAKEKPSSKAEGERLLIEVEAARRLGFARRTLQKWRVTGKGPKFVKVSNRGVRYSSHELDRWIAERTVQSTSEM